MPVLAFDSLDDLVRLVRELPAAGLLPARSVLVRSERQAHALRAALSAAEPALLAGTRLVGTLRAAEDLLRAAGLAFTPGEARLRPVRLARLFRAGVALEHFDARALHSHPGWDEAFASAIHALEAAGLRPADLPRSSAHLRDLSALWAHIDREAGPSWTAARAYAEAASQLERDPHAWPHPGPVLAPVDGHEGAALARFLRALPECTVAIRRARPAHARWIANVVRSCGELPGERVQTPPLHSAPAWPTELQRLQALLFRPDPDPGAATGVFASPPGGPDGSVELEEHAGVESELDAAAAWVARQVLEHEVPLGRVALLVPVLDPLGRLAADRIERLGLAVHVAGAVPAISTAAGARVLAVLRALAARLPAAELAAVLPFLRMLRLRPAERGSAAPTLSASGQAEPPDEEGSTRAHLSHGEALRLAFSLGTAGGSRARPEGALEWSVRALERIGELEVTLAAARGDLGSEGREARHLAATLANLRAVHGSLEALAGVARVFAAGRPLAELWEVLRRFLSDAVLLPGGAARILRPLGEALAPALAAPADASPAGDEALEVVEAALLSVRLARGRFGEPRVFVGTVASAAGLEFDAVRIVGLFEGSIPSAPSEDPVLPAEVRAAVEDHVRTASLPSPQDRVNAQLQSFRAAVLGARRSLVLSAPRVDLARTEREPAALFVEVAAALSRPERGAAALGRPHRTTGAPAAAVPDAQALRRDAFEPARERALAFRLDHPLSEADWLLRVARAEPGRAPDLPPAWRGDPALDLALVTPAFPPVARLGARDGVLDPGGPFPAVPGLSADEPISASALGDLLACPRRFLMSRVLGWKEPAQAPGLRELDPLSFGSLLHRVHEVLYRAHGAAIVAGERTLEHWRTVAREVADRTFHTFLLEFPLLGARIREKQRERLHDAVLAFLEYDWQGERGRRFVDVERGFGTEVPLALDVAGRTLHVRGYIDRLDATSDRTLVRDLKSGRPYPRQGDEEGPVPGRDVQLGLYQRVAVELAGAWKLPPRAVGAYAYANGRGEVRERRFDGDVEKLEEATTRWLALAADLLAAHKFPSTPDESDCGYCPFRHLCGSEEPARAAAGLLAEDDRTLLAFAALKRGEGSP